MSTRIIVVEVVSAAAAVLLRAGAWGLLVMTVAFSSAAGEASGDAAMATPPRSCNPFSGATLLASETASAGYVSNVLKRAGSIRVASYEMLNSALDTARSKEPVQWVIFKSTPELPKVSGDSAEMCAQHEQITEKTPLEFEDKHFATADEMTDWIMDFTRGKGADGKSLYELCPGKCSPKYTWWIEPVESGINVTTRVVCGLPRDHDGNKYLLTTSIAPACPGE